MQSPAPVPPRILPARAPRLTRLLPATIALLGILLPACTPEPTLNELRSDESFATNRFLRVIARPDVSEPEAPPEPEPEAAEPHAAGQRHKGEEGRMGAPSPRSKAGLYAMKGAAGFGIVGTGNGGHGVGQYTSPRRGSFAGDRYGEVDEAAWSQTHAAPLSTFSIDVDTASYSNIRRFLGDGQLPPPDAVRVEEMINYFDYAYPGPTDAAPLTVGAEVTPCPWARGHQLVRVHLQARSIAPEHIPPRNLVFLVDVSGSMNSQDKLPLVKHGLSLLTEQLRDEDRISLVTYAGSTGVALPSTSGADKQKIRRAIDRLGAGGSTNGGAGIVLAYAEARKQRVKGGINRVLLASDGDFNVGVRDHDDLIALIEEQRRTGVFLTVIGVGRGNLNDRTMEQLADRGNGNYAYLDSTREAHKVLVAEAGATLVTVAKDVKMQVEWNPSRVAGYRLIGYENRALTAEQFKDDSKDAGELGAGGSVTALYEVVPAGTPVPGSTVDRLRYQHPVSPAEAELLTIKVRYKQPDADTSASLEVPVSEVKPDWSAASPQLRLAAAVAAFGLKLRGSPHLHNFDLAVARRWAEAAELPDPHGHRRELVALIERAEAVIARDAIHARSALP